MDLSTDLVTALRELGHHADDPTLESTLQALTEALQVAVPSYLGLELVVSSHGYPVVLSTLPSPAAGGRSDVVRGGSSSSPSTSLRVPLVLLGAGFEPGSEIVLHASTRGSLVDLAADLTCLLTLGAGGSTTRHVEPDPPSTAPPVAALAPLDAELPLGGDGAGMRGLAELAAVSRAEGVLIHRGHHPDEVGATLRRQAAAAGVSPHVFALALLRGRGQEPHPARDATDPRRTAGTRSGRRGRTSV